jgi:hypothetical protein
MDGLYRFEEGRGEQLGAAEGYRGGWVTVGDAVWVGGLGMPSVRVGADGSKRAVHLPTRDVNDMVALEDGTLLLTTDGAMLLPGPRPAEPVKEVSLFSLPW